MENWRAWRRAWLTLAMLMIAPYSVVIRYSLPTDSWLQGNIAALLAIHGFVLVGLATGAMLAAMVAMWAGDPWGKRPLYQIPLATVALAILHLLVLPLVLTA